VFVAASLSASTICSRKRFYINGEKYRYPLLQQNYDVSIKHLFLIIGSFNPFKLYMKKETKSPVLHLGQVGAESPFVIVLSESSVDNKFLMWAIRSRQRPLVMNP